jgi:hypothetical protein
MNKILAAIEALASNATHPKFITEALHEIKEEFDALKERVEKLEGKGAPAAVEPAAPAQAAAPAEPAAPVAPAAPAAPAVPPVTA